MPKSYSVDEDGLLAILENYHIGALGAFRHFAHGTGQTTLLLETSQGKAVLRLYENRTLAHVNFEAQLIAFLSSRGYPVPEIIEARDGERVGLFHGKPYILLEFVAGEHCQNPNAEVDAAALSAIVEAVAQLHNLTVEAALTFALDRVPFDTTYCWQQFQRKHGALASAPESLSFKDDLDALEFPEGLPKGICHADLNHGNFLLSGSTIAAVLDLDMCFFGPVIYDIASVIYWWAMPPNEPVRTDTARLIVADYRKHRNLLDLEASHIVDAVKLIVLLGIAWGDHSEIEAELDRVDELIAGDWLSPRG